jgi:hypothetical protein
MLANSRPEMVPVGQIALSPGVAHVNGYVSYGGILLIGAKVTIGCHTAKTDAYNRQFSLDVPASPPAPAHGEPDILRDQLIRVEAYWDAPPGMVSAERRQPLEVGNNNLGEIRLEPHPNGGGESSSMATCG